MAVVTTKGDLPLASLKQELIDSLPEDKEWEDSDTCVTGNLMFLNIVDVEAAEPITVNELDAISNSSFMHPATVEVSTQIVTLVPEIARSGTYIVNRYSDGSAITTFSAAWLEARSLLGADILMQFDYTVEASSVIGHVAITGVNSRAFSDGAKATVLGAPTAEYFIGNPVSGVEGDYARYSYAYNFTLQQLLLQ